MRAVGTVLASLVVCTTSAHAQVGSVFNPTGSGARAAGMANAFIAVSDDGTAASWNPAGLGQLRKPEFSIVTATSRQSLGAQGFRTRDELSTYSPLDASYTSNHIDFGSLAVPVTIASKPVTFQVAWHRLYDLDFRENVATLKTPVSPEGPPPMLISGDSDVVGGFSLLSLAGAVKLTSRLSLGGSFNVWHADWTETTVSSEGFVPATVPPVFERDNQGSRFRGQNLSLGLLLTYPRWRIGLLRQGAASGDFTSGVTRRTSTDARVVFDSIDGTARFPQAIGLGAAWRPAPDWTVALDLTWDQWSHTYFDPKNGPRVDFFNGLRLDQTGTRDTLSANAGAECLLHGEGFVVPLRFGAAWEPQGPRDAYTRDPVNFVMLAAGTGYNTNSLKFDAAFQYRWSNFRAGADFGPGSENQLLPEAVGDRSSKEWRVKLSVIVRVTDTEKLHRTLRRIFG